MQFLPGGRFFLSWALKSFSIFPANAELVNPQDGTFIRFSLFRSSFGRGFADLLPGCDYPLSLPPIGPYPPAHSCSHCSPPASFVRPLVVPQQKYPFLTSWIESFAFFPDRLPLAFATPRPAPFPRRSLVKPVSRAAEATPHSAPAI